MRTIPLVLIAFAALSLSGTGARAADGTWCAFYGTDLTGTNCSFNSLEQCRGTLFGRGGFCRPHTFPGMNFGICGDWGFAPRI